MKRSHLIALAATWQFIYMVDFILPLPLGPSLSAGLGFTVDQMGWLAFAYTGASLIAGLMGSLYVERWPRQHVIIWGLVIFGASQVLTAMSGRLESILACRALAGLAGAPVTAVLMAMVVDAAETDQRGRMIGQVMTGASLAAIVGVPLALSCASWLGWRGVFMLMAVAVVGLLSAALLLLPALFEDPLVPQALPASIELAQPDRTWMRDPAALWACAIHAFSQFSTFLVIPVLASYMVLNLGWREAHLPYLYGVGGALALVCMRLSAWAMDRWENAPPLWLGCVGLSGGLMLLSMPSSIWLALLGFVLFMAANAAKNVSVATVAAQLAPPAQRAPFMNLLSAVQDASILLACAIGALLLSQSHVQAPLEGMPLLMIMAGALILLIPAAYWLGIRRDPVSDADELVSG